MIKVVIIFESITTANLKKFVTFLNDSGIENYNIENTKYITISYYVDPFEVSAEDVIEYDTDFLNKNNISYNDIQCYE